METFITILKLIGLMLANSFLSLIILNMAGLPGALLNLGNKNQNIRYYISVFFAFLGQLYIYLAFVSFIISYCNFKIENDSINKYLLYIIAFFVIVPPIAKMSIDAEKEAKLSSLELLPPQVSALKWTWLISTICFFVFIFNAEIMTSLWGYIPYVK